jgi:RNA polymerase primary sigma factor
MSGTTAQTIGVPLKLHPWQSRALEAWHRAGRQGIIEAVTGSGKTYVAFGALQQLQAEDRRLNTLIVVPSVPLMNQWMKKLSLLFPERGVGRIGGGFSDDFSQFPFACVAVINSAVRHVRRLLDHTMHGSVKCFLIADECHHYIDAPVFRRIRNFPFHYTLGLSATIEPYEVVGLGKVIFEYGFGEANRDNLVPNFDLVNTSVSLTGIEQQAYKQLTDKIGEEIQLLREAFHYELLNVPEHEFFQRLKQLMAREDGSEDPVIKRFFGLLFKRAKIYYMSERKMALATELIRALVQDGRKKAIVFFERIDSAEDVRADVAVEAAAMLRSRIQETMRIWCRVFHSGLRGTERNEVLNEFRVNGQSALLACRCLDEGIDIPEVDAAILVASTQSRRQRIQRIGRTLRSGEHGKRPLVVTLFCQETRDLNVVRNDAEVFAQVATFHETSEQSCVKTVRNLLSKHHPV